jgi:amino acid transporter
MTLAFQGVGSKAQLAAHSANVAVFAAQQVTNSVWAKFVAVAVLSSILATTNAWIVGVARVSYSMARDRVLPQWMGVIHSRFRTPIWATLFFALVSIALTWLDVLTSSVGSAINDSIAIIGFLFAIFYAATAFTATWLYRRRLLESWGNFMLAGVLPLVGTGVLIWVAVKSVEGMTSGQVRAMIVTFVVGLAMLVWARFRWRAPIFALRHDPESEGGFAGTEGTANVAVSGVSGEGAPGPGDASTLKRPERTE